MLGFFARRAKRGEKDLIPRFEENRSDCTESLHNTIDLRSDKIIAAFVSNSVALLADGIYSVCTAIIFFIVWIGLRPMQRELRPLQAV